MGTISRVLAGLSGLLLLAIAYFHSTGLRPLKNALAATEIPAFFAKAIPAQWLFFSWHLAVVAALLLVACAADPRWYLPALVFSCLVTLGDFFWVFGIAGWFPGTVLLLVVVTSLAAAAALKASASRAAGT